MFLRKNTTLLTILLLSILIISFTTSISAQETVKTVKIGIIQALTGPNAMEGQNNLNACMLAIEIINGEFPDLAFDLATTAGLPNLNGAKIEAVIGNSQGEPEFGAAETERLITLSGVVAIEGAEFSGVTKTASRVTERYKTPYIVGCSSAPDLTEKGYKYFFRTTLTDAIFAENFMVFLEDINRKMNANIKKIGYICANSEWGVGTGAAVVKAAETHGFSVVSDIKFPEYTADLDSEVLILKRDQPDFLLAAINASEFLLFARTAKKLDYNPPGFAGFGGGFFFSIDELGEDGEYFMTRDIFSLDLLKEIPLLLKVNQMYKDRYGKDFDGDSIRSFTAMMALGDAINRAGSVDKEAIRKALTETNIPADQLIVTWEGIKFDEKGQNILGRGIVRQRLDGEYKTVWPFDVATAEIVFPMPKWSER
jgi:branched-chain amino acid transport system substrate-binding protein